MHAFRDIVHKYRRSITMVDYQEILRLINLGYTRKNIASSVHSYRNTISEVLAPVTRPSYKNFLTWICINIIMMYLCSSHIVCII